MDFLVVADLATWIVSKFTYVSPKSHYYNEDFIKLYGPNGYSSTGYICFSIENEKQEDYFSPLGVLLSNLYSKLSWMFHDMRHLEEYFRKANLMGRGEGYSRLWNIDIFSEQIRDRVYNGFLTSGVPFDEWSVMFH